jgi:hypothetical protein
LASKKNLKDLVHENEEKDERIREELEEEVKHNKRDKERIKEFILCVEKVRISFMKW